MVQGLERQDTSCSEKVKHSQYLDRTVAVSLNAFARDGGSLVQAALAEHTTAP